ncbi:hypothetical protein PMAYCL1PPCAC_01931, partial [Pristionchus mayeri]
ITPVLFISRMFTPLLLSFFAHSVLSSNSSNSLCPDASSCPGSQTCCLSPSASYYNCCPYALASCCIDRIHCCPSGTYCSGIHCLRSTDNSTIAEDGKILATKIGEAKKAAAQP